MDKMGHIGNMDTQLNDIRAQEPDTERIIHICAACMANWNLSAASGHHPHCVSLCPAEVETLEQVLSKARKVIDTPTEGKL